MVERFDTSAAIRRAMHLASALGAAWARDEMMENPRTFKTPAAEQALREFLEQAFAEATAGVPESQPRECSTCAHEATHALAYPCRGCKDNALWEPSTSGVPRLDEPEQKGGA